MKMEIEQAKQEYETLLKRWNKAETYCNDMTILAEDKQKWEDEIIKMAKRLGELHNIIYGNK